MWEQAAVVMSGRRVSRALQAKTVSKKDAIMLNELGINRDMGIRIRDMLSKYQEDGTGVSLFNVRAWEDREAARVFSLALNKQSKRSVLHVGTADKPNFANTPIGQTLTQFWSFAFAQMNRTMIPAFQRLDAETAAFMTMSFSLGALIAQLKSITGGRGVIEDEGKLAVEAIDRSGFLSVPFLINPYMEQMGIGLSRFTDEESARSGYQDSSRLYGATGSYIADAVKGINGLTDGTVTENDVKRATRLMPYGNHFAVQPIVKKLLEEANLPKKNKTKTKRRF
jgi:hypothetical protein